MSTSERVNPYRTPAGLTDRRVGWTRALIIAAVIVASAGIAAVFNQDLLGYILILILGGGFALVYLRWPGIGLISLVIASMFISYSGPSNLNATVMLLALLLGLWVADMIIRDRSIQLISSRTFLPLFGLVVTAILSFGAGLLPWYSFVSQAPLGAQLAGLSIFVLSAGAYLLMAHRIRTVLWLKAITWTFITLGAVFIIGRAFPIVGQLTEPFYLGMGPVFWVWFVAIAFSQAAFNDQLSGIVRVVLGVVIVIAIYVLLIQKFNDKSGWMPAIFCIGVILSVRSPKYILLLGVLGLLSVMVTTVVSDAVSTEEYSISTRLDAITILLEIVKVNPILGLGFANYYWYTPLFPIRGFAVQFNSHNNYVDIFAQTGVLGLLFFLWFALEAGRLGWSLRDRVAAGFEQAYVYGALGGLAGMLFLGLFADWVLPFFYNVGLGGFRTAAIGWLFLGGLAFFAHGQNVKAHQEDPGL